MLDNLSAALQAAGTGTGALVKLHVYLAQAGLMAGVQEQFKRHFAGKTKPAVSFVVGELAHAGGVGQPGLGITMDIIGVVPW